MSKKDRLLSFTEKTSTLVANVPIKPNTPRNRGEWIGYSSELRPAVKKRFRYVCALNEYKMKEILNKLVSDFLLEYDSSGRKIDRTNLNFKEV